MRSRQCRTLREAVGIRRRIHFSRYYMTPLIGKGLSETCRYDSMCFLIAMAIASERLAAPNFV